MQVAHKYSLLTILSFSQFALSLVACGGESRDALEGSGGLGGAPFLASASGGSVPTLGQGSGGLLANPPEVPVCETASSPTGSTPAAYYGPLRIRDGKVVSARNCQPVQLQGLSFFWSNSGWGQEYWWSKEHVTDFVQNWKVELLRAAMGVDDQGGLLSDENNKWRLMAVVDAAIEQGIYVIIDFHSHHAHEHTDVAKSFFREMAEKYGAYDNVLFEIYNEPLDSTSWETIKAYANEVIPVIREHSNNLIIVGTRQWSQRVDEAADSPLTFDNVAYTYHFYVSQHGSDVMGYAKKALEKRLPLFVTEWGFWGPTSGGDTGISGDAWMSFLDENSISSAAWAISTKDEPASLFYGDSSSLRDAGAFIQPRILLHANAAPY